MIVRVDDAPWGVDTVLECTVCRERIRWSAPEAPDPADTSDYLAFVLGATEITAAEHRCPGVSGVIDDQAAYLRGFIRGVASPAGERPAPDDPFFLAQEERLLGMLRLHAFTALQTRF